MSLNLSFVTPDQIRQPRVEWVPIAERPIIGKDVLELLSSSMYVNALSIYREYIQNAADAIDVARISGVLEPKEVGRVDINVNHQQRLVRIRDNGTGLGQNAFVERLIAFGASRKRGSRARGFRGVGRLAGLGYCQELIFRSRAEGESQVSELRWDCRKLKALLRNQQPAENLEKLVGDVVTTRRMKGMDYPRHFFEVELVGIVRHGNDLLIDSFAIENYLSQVAPVPFAPEFGFGEQIEAALRSKVDLGNIQVYVNDSGRPIYRPHRNQFQARKTVQDSFGELQFLTIPGSDGNVAATGWILHHSYLGALPNISNVNGLRLRSGNMQIGEAHLLTEIFPEPRFNSWVVGEVHVIDERILPNGRRDQFEQSVHFSNVLNQLSPIARSLVQRCRTSSIQRNWARQFEQGVASLDERLAILRQGAITPGRRASIRDEIDECVMKLEKIASSQALDANAQSGYRTRLKRLNAKISRLLDSNTPHRKLARLRGSRRRLVERLVDLIYDSSANEASARLLIEKILRRL